MTKSYPLGSLYKKRSPEFSLLPIIDKEIHAYILGEDVCIENISIDQIDSWQHLFYVRLLADLSQNAPQASINALSNKAHVLIQSHQQEHSQYLRLFIALHHTLAGLPVPIIAPDLLPSGAALLDPNEYCRWRSLPYLPKHAEFGTLLTLMAAITQNHSLAESALRMAHWQLNSLDHEYLPFPSLFVRENESRLPTYLAWNYLFFHAIALITNRQDFETIAQKHLAKLTLLAEVPDFTVDPFLLLIEAKIEASDGALEPSPLHMASSIELPSLFSDETTALMGYRSQDKNIVCTLHGGYTGLGCFAIKSGGIVNYGPQHVISIGSAPKDGCSGFGIEGNYLSDHGMRQTRLHLTKNGFSLKGYTRLVDQPVKSISSLGKFCGLWMETEQIFQDDKLQLNTSLLGFEGFEQMGFTFFLKADQCQIEGEEVQEYHGALKTLLFNVNGDFLKLMHLHESGSMEVRLIADQNRYWGANIQVIYRCDKLNRKYGWKILRVVNPAD